MSGRVYKAEYISVCVLHADCRHCVAVQRIARSRPQSARDSCPATRQDPQIPSAHFHAGDGVSELYFTTAKMDTLAYGV